MHKDMGRPDEQGEGEEVEAELGEAREEGGGWARAQGKEGEK